jgi:3-dehydroquinate synthase
VRIDVGSRAGRYAVHIAPGASKALPEQLAATGGRRAIILSNPLVWRLLGDRFAGVSADDPILVADGERFKNLQTVGRIYDGLIRAHADRATTIVAVGGGVLGDTAGFAAATFLRGLPLIQVPTTLLAQVDSSIGGKVGVNHAAGKNLIGAFYPPRTVIVDPELLDTLPRREFRAGLYEVIKYGVIASRPLFDTLVTRMKALFARDVAAMSAVIEASCTIKARIVEADELETGARRTLNFGHTVGHALEAVTKYRRFRHGEAVGYGMLAAAEIAAARGVMPAADRDALAALVRAMGPLPAVSDVPAAQILEAIGRDKKIVDGRLHFVMPGPIGECRVVPDVTTGEIESSLRAIGIVAP